MYGRTLSNKGSRPAADQKNGGAAEDSGMPCPVPIQPHSAKVYYQSSDDFSFFTCLDCCYLFFQCLSLLVLPLVRVLDSNNSYGKNPQRFLLAQH